MQRCGSNPDFLLGGRTSASAKCRHWSAGQSVGQAAQFCLETFCWVNCRCLFRWPIRNSAQDWKRICNREVEDYIYSSQSRT